MPDKPRYLTKSRFQLAEQCPTKLFFYGKEEYPNNKQNEFMAALAEGGFQVGALAKCYFPEGHDINELDINKALQQTNDFLKQDNVTIFEAAILYKNLFIRVDILKKTANKIELIEVKAKSYNCREDHFFTKRGGRHITSGWRPYLTDIAFQTWVSSKAFPDYKIEPYLMLADKTARASVDGLNQHFFLKKTESEHSYIELKGEVSPPHVLGDKILTIVPVDEAVEMIIKGEDIADDKKSPEQKMPFEKRIEMYARYYQQDKRYPSHLGRKCKYCEYRVSERDLKEGQKMGYNECWQLKLGWDEKQFHKPHIFDIWDFRRSDECIQNGIYLMEDMDPVEEFMQKKKKEDILVFKSAHAERQHLQLERALHPGDKNEDIKPGLFEELDSWHYPLHFIDFETSMIAIPFNKGRRPYEQIAFQFSSHTLYEDGRIQHDQWIQQEPGIFPNFDFITALKNVLDKDKGTILRFATHENTVLRQIHDQITDARDNGLGVLPENHNALLAFIDEITSWKEEVIINGKKEQIIHSGERSMIDMCALVREYYYHPAMGGSNSIKVVLPTVMQNSAFLKEKYSRARQTTNSGEMTWWQEDAQSGFPKNPYKLLPPLFEEHEFVADELVLESGYILDGGAAMTAYAKMQFSEMSPAQRQKVINGLLKYCELDTLAMVMIWEHWKSLM